MKRNISVQLKAVFLLIVFGLNTMVGLACAVGVDMGFNTNHHHHDEETEIHEHSESISDPQHNEASKYEQEENKTDKQEKKGCCNDDVQKFQLLDKALNQNAKTIIAIPVFAVIISTFLGVDVFAISRVYPPKYKVRFFYPPPIDIRIAIQSFQI